MNPLEAQIESLLRKVKVAEHAEIAITGSAGNATKLCASGYPLRAVQALAAMTVPALAKAQEKLPQVLKDGMLLLIGPTGRGKTVMATWLADQRLSAGKSCGKFATAYQVFARMKQCWTKGEDSEAVLQSWKTTRFLVIDEMQIRCESAWENAVLDELINARYAAMRPTVMIGNIEPGKEQAVLGARIIDRVRETGGIINCNWPSYR